MVSTIAATVVARAFDVGVAAGVPAAELESLLRRRRSELVDGARVPLESSYACFAHCLTRTLDPSFPIRVAQSVTLEDYSVLGFGFLTSANLDEAFELTFGAALSERLSSARSVEIELCRPAEV